MWLSPLNLSKTVLCLPFSNCLLRKPKDASPQLGVGDLPFFHILPDSASRLVGRNPIPTMAKADHRHLGSEKEKEREFLVHTVFAFPVGEI